jgi:hypothetical protein
MGCWRTLGDYRTRADVRFEVGRTDPYGPTALAKTIGVQTAAADCVAHRVIANSQKTRGFADCQETFKLVGRSNSLPSRRFATRSGVAPVVAATLFRPISLLRVHSHFVRNLALRCARTGSCRERQDA